MAKEMGLKIGAISKAVLFLCLAAVAAITAANYWMPQWTLGQYIAPILVLGMSLFVFAEVSFFEGFKKKDYIKIIGAVVALVAMLGVVLELGGITIAFLDSIKGIVSALLAIFFVIEGFR